FFQAEDGIRGLTVTGVQKCALPILNAGTGSVHFNEDLGATQSLGLLTIENASRVVFGQGDTESPGSGTTGPVNQINTSGAINIRSEERRVGRSVEPDRGRTLKREKK